jgi:hypothetical protein
MDLQLGLMGAMGLDLYPPAVDALAAAYPGGSWLATGIYPSPNGVIPQLPSFAAVMAWELFVPSVIGNGTIPYAWSGDPSDLAVRESTDHRGCFGYRAHLDMEWNTLICPWSQ